jgi:hypothetical protein
MNTETKFVIQYGMTMPKSKTGRTSAYPFDQMNVGASFDAPRDMGKTKTGSDKRQNTLTACASAWAKKNGGTAKFKTAIMDDNTVRVMRIL